MLPLSKDSSFGPFLVRKTKLGKKSFETGRNLGLGVECADQLFPAVGVDVDDFDAQVE